MRYRTCWLAALFVLAAPLAAPLKAEGTLVIVGGGLADDNDAVFAAFLAAVPSPDAPIAIIPAASGVPVQSAAAFAAQLERRGVAPGRIRVIRLAVEDDPSTPEDERRWASNGEAADEVAQLAQVGGIWFTGGDQARITAALLRRDGTATAMLAAIRAAHRQGAVIGGTSAGAAIMSDPMILEGDPLSLVPGAGEAREAIRTGAGLGFVRRFLVDQHFGERARLPRLAAALRSFSRQDRIGLGIDEDTALVVAPDQQSAQVAGRGQVTFLDARTAHFADGAQFAMRGAVVEMVHAGERIDLVTLVPPGGAEQPPQPPQPCLSAPSAAGLAASQSAVIAGVIGSLEAGAEAVCLISAGKAGLALRFWRAGDASQRRVMLDIEPVAVRREPL
jgi:cyanophycinase